MIEYKFITPEMYDQLAALWKAIDGLGLRSVDDSYEGIAKYLRRNPASSFGAFDGDKLVGCILCGHDGRRGFIYHTCVRPEYRHSGIGGAFVTRALDALKTEGITKCALVAFSKNEIGCRFWGKIWLDAQTRPQLL